jgi:hypothetical protein
MAELLTQLRQFLDYHREVALMDLAGIMIRHGATDEELERELDHHERMWQDDADREMARFAAWLGRGGQSLQ